MGRLEDLRINAYLSEVARGYTNSAFIADALFPTIESELEKVDIFEFNKEAFQVYNTEREIRADSNVVSPKGFNKKVLETLVKHFPPRGSETIREYFVRSMYSLKK